MRKKKNKKKLIENLIIFGFFLIFTSYLDINIDKSNVNLIANENLYETINAKEMIILLGFMTYYLQLIKLFLDGPA